MIVNNVLIENIDKVMVDFEPKILITIKKYPKDQYKEITLTFKAEDLLTVQQLPQQTVLVFNINYTVVIYLLPTDEKSYQCMSCLKRIAQANDLVNRGIEKKEYAYFNTIWSFWDTEEEE